MEPFGELYLRDLGVGDDGRQRFELSNDLHYSARPCPGCRLEIVVPRGFTTDFASVPRFFWRIFPPSGAYNKAAVIHDYLYVHGDCTKFFADSIFRDAMEQLGVPLWQRWLMYCAVRVFGRGNFQAKQGQRH